MGKDTGGKKGENAYEIDLVGRNAQAAYAFEFKWKRLGWREAEKILEELKAKARHLQSPIDGMKFGVVAKSIDDKRRLADQGYLAYDLRDFQFPSWARL
ncbi:hypothetical protein HY095_04555 [Candidatus Micrarchaeota archaeon]|nr:hypothetical protein [Candidatus Micrarchaeota archaeon]